MNQQELLAAIEEILKTKSVTWKNVDLGRSTAVGIDNVVGFDVTNGGFIALVDPEELKELEGRKEANMVTNEFVPAHDKLFVNIEGQDEKETIEFWVGKTLQYLEKKKASSH